MNYTYDDYDATKPPEIHQREGSQFRAGWIAIIVSFSILATMVLLEVWATKVEQRSRTRVQRIPVLEPGPIVLPDGTLLPDRLQGPEYQYVAIPPSIWEAEPWKFIPLVAILISGAWPLYRLLARRHKIKLQHKRDAEGLASEFRALFLRPFFSDKRLRFENPFRRPFYPESMFLEPPEFVGRVLEPYIDVVQFGGELNEVSNARISTSYECSDRPRARSIARRSSSARRPRRGSDTGSMALGDHWKPQFKDQVRQAALVVIIPLLRSNDRTARVEGEDTIWELDYLSRMGLLERAIVVMPNRPGLFGKWVDKSWNLARLRAAQLGIPLPEYAKSGDVMTFTFRGGSWQLVPGFCGAWKGRGRLAAGMVAAVHSLAERHRFTLLAR